jgi:VWFA-related protein
MGFRLAIALSCLWATATAVVNAQTPEATGAETTTLSTRSTLVLVPALVRDKSGKLVYTLGVNDFSLTDDGVPQRLTLEHDTEVEPLALVVAIEGGGAGVRELDKYRALAPMLESVIGGVEHKVAVVGFDSSPVLVQDFTPDVDLAAQGVQALIKDDSGDSGAAILDALGFSLDLLRKQPPQYRRAILLISQTLDRGSRMKLDEAVRAISDTNTAIYSIGFSTGKYEVGHDASKISSAQPGPAGGCMTKDHSGDPETSSNRAGQTYDCLSELAPPLRLAKMAMIAVRDGLAKNVPETVARHTGGEYFKLTSAKSLEGDLQTISNHIHNRYILSFQPQSPHAGFHAIALHVPDYAHLEISARDGYWVETGVDSPASPVR